MFRDSGDNLLVSSVFFSLLFLLIVNNNLQIIQDVYFLNNELEQPSLNSLSRNLALLHSVNREYSHFTYMLCYVFVTNCPALSSCQGLQMIWLNLAHLHDES